MDTVTTQARPRFGTVESFAGILRPKHGDHVALDGVLDYVLNCADCPDAQRVEWARNALAAATMVRAELAARR